jgi:hypothetical protein
MDDAQAQLSEALSHGAHPDGPSWSDSTTSGYTSFMSTEALRLHEAAMDWPDVERMQLVVALAESSGEHVSAEVRQRVEGR